MNACYDDYKPVDYNYRELLWFAWVDISKLKIKDIPRKKLIIWDQWANRRTRMACTRYNVTHIANLQQLVKVLNEWFSASKVNQINPAVIWEEALQEVPSREQNWDWLQNWPKHLKKRWMIGWFGAVWWLHETLLALANDHYIASGSNDWDWDTVRDSWIYIRANRITFWHAFAIVGYDMDRKVFICINSYWPNNWYFEMSFMLLDTLFTRLAILPTDFTDLINKYKMERDKKTIEVAVSNWIYNWQRPTDHVTREESALMNIRSIVLTLQKTTHKWKTFDEILDEISK